MGGLIQRQSTRAIIAIPQACQVLPKSEVVWDRLEAHEREECAPLPLILGCGTMS